MYEIKNRIYHDFDKTQKTALCNFLRALVKKSPELSEEDVMQKFLDDERYYEEVHASRFEFLEKFLDDDAFLNETMLYISECKKYYDYKKKQEPIIKAQKEFEKKKRKFLQEVKMSKEPPTKKQIYYYKRLCKKYSIEMKEEKELSKLDLRNLIEEIINEHQTDYTNID
ncbi:hypothetical protein KBA27_05625 [bacterium]|nr:hypothetical protein [bacterium]